MESKYLMNLGAVYFLSTDDRINVVKYDYHGKFHRQISRSKIINRQKDFELNSLSHSQISNVSFFLIHTLVDFTLMFISNQL